MRGANFWRVIRRLADEGTTIFVTTHYMDEAEYCDRVGLMVAGKLAALDTPESLKRNFVPGRMYEVQGASAAEVQKAAADLASRSTSSRSAQRFTFASPRAGRMPMRSRRELTRRGAP